jgi:hypothetical protein
MPHKTTKKVLAKGKKKVKQFAETVVSRAQRSDLLPDIPGPDPVINAVATIAALHPAVRIPLMGYMMAENTEKYWGPHVYGAADNYMDWYEKNVRAQYAGSEIDPRSPLGYRPPTEVYDMSKLPSTKRSRKISKAGEYTQSEGKTLLELRTKKYS